MDGWMDGWMVRWMDGWTDLTRSDTLQSGGWRPALWMTAVTFFRIQVTLMMETIIPSKH